MSVADRSWEIVQEKAFTSWLNETLKQRSMKVENLYLDLSDGVKLANFLEILAGKNMPKKVDPKPANRIYVIQNLNLVLEFLKKEVLPNSKNLAVAAEDIADTETKGIKFVLGLIWTLFRKYRISVISHQDKSSEEALLLWVKNVTDGYNGVNIESFKTSFKDGKAFMAMVHRFNPATSGIKYDEIDKDDPRKNLSLAFDLAEKELGIPKLLDVDELAEGRTDERSLVLYTSLFFHAFKSADVASDLQKQRLSVEESLAFEKKRNEDLSSTNTLLEDTVTQLTLELDGLKVRTSELDQNLKDERSKIASLEDIIKKLTLELQQKEESNIKLGHDKDALQRELDELKQKLASEISKRESFEKNGADRQAQDEQKIQEFKKKTASFEDEIESLKNEVANFKVLLDSERKDKDEQRRLIDDHSSQDAVHRKGLQVLKRNLDQHIEDLTTWRGYLEVKDKATFDFESEVRRALEGDLEGKDFVEQLNHLSGKLDTENELMLKLLKQKIVEAKEAAVKAKKEEPKK